MNATLGEKIKELRQGANLSLRQLADKVKKSPPFISDIELGRRYPSDDVLQDIAKELGTSFDDLKKLDTRDSVPLLKKMVENNPAWGLAFRTVAEAGREGRITPQELLNRLNQAPADRRNERKTR